MRRGHRTVSVDAEVSLDEFAEDDILDEACDILKDHRAKPKPTEEWALKSWKRIDEAAHKLAQALSVALPDEANYPPASTAAKIRTMDELKALLAKQN